MALSDWLTVVAVCLLGAMSPGPSLAVVVGSTLHGGRRAGIASALAHGIGVGLYALLTVAGLAVLLTQTRAVHLWVQLLGAAYLCYLGSQALRSSGAGAGSHQDLGRRGNAASRGFFVAFLNPKLAIFMLALFSQFLTPELELSSKLILVTTAATVDALWYCLIVGLISRARVLAVLQRNAQRIDRVFGAVLILLAMAMLLRVILGEG